MPNAAEETSSAWTPEVRRAPATAIGGVRSHRATDQVPQQRRPFTSIGGSLFDLDGTRSSSPRANLLEPVRSTVSRRQTKKDAAAGVFDVRKFLLDQKGSEPLHMSALFRASTVTVSDHQPTASSTSTHASKKLLPRMDHAKKQHLHPSGSTNQAHGASAAPPAEDTVSHFYTIEKMAESCFHAVQSKHQKTWQFLPGAEERSKSSSGASANASSGGANSLTNVERPSRRVDVIDLDKCFDIAMQFVQKKHQWDTGSTATHRLATLDRDVVTIQAKVAQRYGLTGRIGEMRVAAGGDRGTKEEEEEDDDAASDGLSEDQKTLARTLFEQKWSDVVLGEIEAMLTTSFLEQGSLLRKTRNCYAKSFFKLEKLYNARSNELGAALEELQRTREELRRASETHAQDTQQMKSQYEDEIRRLSVGFESRREEMERKMVESKDQMTKMGDTMKTLNTIFRQMREDTDKVKAVELRENYIKLEKKFEACKEEVERLRPLVQLNQRLVDQKEAILVENQALKDKIANFDPLIASKDDVIANLMEQQSELIAAQELRAAQEEELRRMEEAKAADDEDDENDGFGGDFESSGGTSERGRRAGAYPRGKGSAAVCVRCKESLRSMSQVGTLTVTQDHSSGSGGAQADEADLMKDPVSSGMLEIRKKRIQCLYFRILLPNLRGRRPQRELSWTLSCMRSIVFAKQLDDAMCKRSGGAFPLRIRMPEFVYSWFSPWRSLRDEKRIAQDGDDDPFAEEDVEGDRDGGGQRGGASDAASKERTDEQKQMQADEDRWCLYYGVKALVQEGYLEAKLFLSLLDEKYGEDEQVFMLYCYRVLDVLLGGKINWGPMRDHVSYVIFSAQYEKLFGTRQGSSELLKSIEAGPRVPKTIWISPYHASLATSIVLCKATEAERAVLDKKLLEFAVTNLSEHERPTVYLTAANVESLRFSSLNHDGVKPAKKRREADDDDDDTADKKPLQFVDANLWVELMMMEYKEEQAHRRAAIRLMFQTATAISSSLSGSVTRSSTSGSAAAMDMEQFQIMIRTLNDEIPSFMVATLFRMAYISGNGAVNFDSFLNAAEYAQFFSSCMRLENPVASIARLAAESGHHNVQAPTHAAMSTSSRAAFLVDKYFTFMHKQMQAMTAELPVWTRSLADALVYELSSSLMDENGSSSGGGALADGVHLLTSFHRLLDALLMSSLVKKDATGCILSSKSIFCFEKALQALLDCVRLGDKTIVEQLIDTVRQNLSVKRVQTVFRKHLQRDDGAPLVMRPLFHPTYSTHRAKYRTRRAERPLKWLHFVIADVLRRSMRGDRVHWMLTELSGVSSVLLQNANAIPQGPNQSMTRNVNGGIGPAPKPLIVELVYDCLVERFGTRWEAERLIHDVFVTCRSYVTESSLALLFSYLCCMNDASPDDRIMGQNEAVAFLHGVFRCGLHSFQVINPASNVSSIATVVETPREDKPSQDTSDLISQRATEDILFAAFAKLGADQKQRMKSRLDEQLTIWKTPGLSSVPAAALRGSFVVKANEDLAPQQFMTADAFLVLALNEWKRYIQHRMNELRVICCSMEDEIAQFGASLPLDTIAAMLQKANVTFSNDELCTIFRRVCVTEQRGNVEAAATKPDRHPSSFSTFKLMPSMRQMPSQPLKSVDHMSDRIAAACFPLLARETTLELQRLEHAAPVPFKLQAPVEEKAKFLVESWRAYDEPCRALLDELRRLGKNNDIRAEAYSRRAPINGGRAIQRDVLYLSSSVSSDTLSSQDVAQLEALHSLFLERLEKMNEELSKQPDAASYRRASTKLMNDLTNARRMSVHPPSGPLVLDDDAKDALLNSRVVLVNETWKVFRQLLVMFSRLRTLAGLGDGPLPDKWDPAPAFAVGEAPASA